MRIESPPFTCVLNMIPTIHNAHAAADRLQDPEVKDLDFMHVKDHPQELLASVAADGSCVIWHLQAQHGQLQAQQLTQLEPPKSKEGALLTRDSLHACHNPTPLNARALHQDHKQQGNCCRKDGHGAA